MMGNWVGSNVVHNPYSCGREVNNKELKPKEDKHLLTSTVRRQSKC